MLQMRFVAKSETWGGLEDALNKALEAAKQREINPGESTDDGFTFYVYEVKEVEDKKV